MVGCSPHQTATMLGLTPWLLSRPLGHRSSTRTLPTVTKPWKHAFIPHGALRTVRGGRYKSTVAGDNDSGHIEAKKNEGILFIDSEYSTSS